MFGVVPRVLWERVCPPDELNRIRLNMNCLFVETPDERILIETGIGEKWTAKELSIHGIFRSKPFAQSLFEITGCRPEDITIVVNTHLHFDHAGSIERFPGAEVVVSRPERAAALAASGPLSPFRPTDFDDVARWRPLELEGEAPYATFSDHVDLLGDGSLEIVPLPGHTLGSIGMIARLIDGPVLFAGDAAAVEESWRFAAFPARSEDRDAWWDSIWRIKKFLQLVPDAVVAGGHDLPVERVQGRSTIVVHSRQ